MAGVGKEQDSQPLVVGLLEPLVELIVHEALAGPVARFGIAAEQQDLVLAVLPAARDPLRLLRTVAGVGQHQGIAGLGTGHQVLPILDQGIAAGLGVEPDAQILDPQGLQGRGDVLGIRHRALEGGAMPIFVDADDQGADLGLDQAGGQQFQTDQQSAKAPSTKEG